MTYTGEIWICGLCGRTQFRQLLKGKRAGEYRDEFEKPEEEWADHGDMVERFGTICPDCHKRLMDAAEREAAAIQTENAYQTKKVEVILQKGDME